MASGLEDELGRLLGVDGKKYGLRTLADMANDRHDINLHKELYELFTIKNRDKNQDEILRKPWRRIYTTNFDDTVETAFLEHSIDAKSYTHADNLPKTIGNGSVIHLHGSISNASEENVLAHLILNHESYVSQSFDSSPWFVQFLRDLESCYACYFIGYNLNDYHINAPLMQNSAICDKTYFVTEENPDSESVKHLEKYGTVLKIELEGFVRICNSLLKPKETNDPRSVQSFIFLDPRADRKSSPDPTASEIRKIVTRGDFHFHRYVSTLNSGEYGIAREQHIESAILKLKKARHLLVHSSMGNGKTIFLKMLAHKLSTEGYKCFWFKSNSEIQRRDLLTFQSLDKIALFFDSYDDANATIKISESFPADTKEIVAIRTGVHELRQHEIIRRFPASRMSLEINGLTPTEANNFKIWLDRSGIRVPGLEAVIDKCIDFRDVVLKLYKNEEIAKSIAEEIEPLFEDAAFKDVFITTHLLKTAGFDVDIGFLHTVTGCNAIKVLDRFREIAADMFDFEHGSIVPRSAIFSEHLIDNHLESSDKVKCIYNILVQSVKMKEQSHYRAIMGKFMQYKFLCYVLRSDTENREKLLTELFEDIRKETKLNDDPLFWLQYAILKTDSNEIQLAENFIETAYARAANLEKFKTFQIDTFALGLLLQIEAKSTNKDSVVRFQKIIDLMDRVQSMIADENQRYFAIEVLEHVEPFVQSRVETLSAGEKESFIIFLKLTVDAFATLPEDVRIYTGSDEIKKGLQRSMFTLETDLAKNRN